MKVEVLYFESCPNYKPTVERLKRVLEEERLSAEVIEVEVLNSEVARAVGFLGSPTIRIDGRDIEPAARMVPEFGLACRRYPEGLPSDELIRSAILEAQGDKP